MIRRLSNMLPTLTLAVLAGGCSGLDQRSETITLIPPVTQHTASPTQQVAAVDHDHTMRNVVFHEPAAADPEVMIDTIPTPQSIQADVVRSTSPTDSGQSVSPIASQLGTEQPQTIELDLTSALAMAAGQNPQIAFASARYREAYARLESAQVLWLPSIRAGMSFNHHEGTLQASPGDVISTSRSSLQTGLGVQAVGAGTPAVPGVAAQFHTSDAVFQPKIAAHNASARNAAIEVTRNDLMLATALAHLNLVRASLGLRIAEETHDNAKKLADLTATFARTGQGPQADADRARTELVRRQNDVARAQENVRVASARLAQLLSLDPSSEIVPQEPTIVPIDLVAYEVPAAELVATGLANRPELAEAQYLVCEAVYRYRREKYAPLLPSVLLGISQGGFGGGLGSRIDNYRGRFDLDATVYWELRNFGFGERAKRDETRSQYDQARALQVSIMDRVAREVVEAQAQVLSRKGQIEVAQAGVEAATDSYRRNLQRIREGQGLPLEALQSLQALDEARREYLRTLADYNAAQFQLQRALGWPIQ